MEIYISFSENFSPFKDLPSGEYIHFYEIVNSVFKFLNSRFPTARFYISPNVSYFMSYVFHLD